MANSFSNTFAPEARINWSNRRTDDFLFTWLVAANDEARTDWELLFTAWLNERTQTWCPSGCAGFDVVDIPWQHSRLAEQRDFLVRSVIAAQKLLIQHPGGVFASGFVVDGARIRAGRPALYPPETIAVLDPALHAAFDTLRAWLEAIPPRSLAERVEGWSVVFVTPWRDDPFPDDVTALRCCTMHAIVYAPRVEDRGCAMCEENRLRARLARQ